MSAKRSVDKLAELRFVVCQKCRSLFECDPCRAVAAFVNCVAACLVAEKVDVDVFGIRIFEKIDYISVVSNADRFLFLNIFKCFLECLFCAVGDERYPALGMSRFDPRSIDFGEDTDAFSDFDRFRLCAAHAAETAGNEEFAAKVAVPRNAEFHSSRDEDRVVRAVNDALRTDIHPAACSHLTVVRYTERSGAVEVLHIVEKADHKSVRRDDSRCSFVRFEEAERMSAVENERLFVGHHFEIFFDEAVLHPVLADLARFAVSYEFVRIKRCREVEVVVYHYLERFAFDAVSFV